MSEETETSTEATRRMLSATVQSGPIQSEEVAEGVVTSRPTVQGLPPAPSGEA
jgi:hypothetical protein